MTIMTQQNPAPKRGDVVLVLFPHSDLQTAKTRPALIVQSNGLNTGLSQVIIAMITSRTFRANHPSRVFVKIKSKAGKQRAWWICSAVLIHE